MLWFSLNIRRLHPVPDQSRPEQDQRHEDQRDALPPPAADHEVPHCPCGKDQHGQQGDKEHENGLPQSDVDQQQIRVEDEQEGQQGRAKAVEKGCETRAQRVTARDRGSGKGCQPDGRRHVGHDAVVEHEHMHGDERDNEPGLCAQLHHHVCHQGRDHNVVGGCRQAHAEDDRNQGHKEQHGEQVSAREELDKLCHHLTNAGQRYRAYDHTSNAHRGCQADHVACAGDHAFCQIIDAMPERREEAHIAPEQGFQRSLRDQNDDEETGRPERGEGWRFPLNHQEPDQHDDRQDVVETRQRHFSKAWQHHHPLVGIIDLQIRTA